MGVGEARGVGGLGGALDGGGREEEGLVGGVPAPDPWDRGGFVWNKGGVGRWCRESPPSTCVPIGRGGGEHEGMGCILLLEFRHMDLSG